MTTPIMVATPVAAYLTTAPGSRIWVGDQFEQRAPGGFLNFTPTGAVGAHPHALHDTLQTEGFLLVSDPSLIDALDKLIEQGNVPFIRHPNPEICVGTEADTGVPVGD